VFVFSVAMTLSAQMQGVFDGAVFSGCDFSQVSKCPAPSDCSKSCHVLSAGTT
jgi:hypothetical protein